eukprot:365292-Chlamydomonas_euryale.AAC.4
MAWWRWQLNLERSDGMCAPTSNFCIQLIPTATEPKIPTPSACPCRFLSASEVRLRCPCADAAALVRQPLAPQGSSMTRPSPGQNGSG